MISPRSILITGAAGAIGSALASVYAEPDVHLHLGDIDAQGLADIEARCRNFGARVQSCVVDVTDRAGMKAWIEAAEGSRPLELVLSIAGISHGSVKREETSQEIRAVFAVNLEGMLNVVLFTLPFFRTRQRGQFGLMSSQAGARGFPVAPSYSSTKAAIRIYGEAIRGRLSRENIGVTVINPGFVQSPMTDANPYFMPFRVTTQRAARIIRRGLDKNKAHIAFPWPITAATWFLSLLPASLFHRFWALK